jgi:hypothetical protein
VSRAKTGLGIQRYGRQTVSVRPSSKLVVLALFWTLLEALQPGNAGHADHEICRVLIDANQPTYHSTASSAMTPVSNTLPALSVRASTIWWSSHTAFYHSLTLPLYPARDPHIVPLDRVSHLESPDQSYVLYLASKAGSMNSTRPDASADNFCASATRLRSSTRSSANALAPLGIPSVSHHCPLHPYLLLLLPLVVLLMPKTNDEAASLSARRDTFLAAALAERLLVTA